MRSRYVITLIFWVCWYSLAQSQPIFKSYTVTQGLVNNAVRGIYQDSGGFLWISTWEGLSRYDGHHFTNYSATSAIPHSMVNDVIEIAKDELLVAMNDGSMSLIRQGKATTIVIKEIPVNHFFRASNNELLAAADHAGLVKITGNKAVRTKPVDQNSHFQIVEYPKGEFLGVGENVAVTQYDNQFRKIASTSTSNFLPLCIYPDRQKRIWLGTESGLKLIKVPDVPGKKIEFLPLPGFLQNTLAATAFVYAISQDEDNTLWLGTSEGLFEVESSGNIRLYTENDGLPSRRVNAIFRDREKNLWVGTYAGLAKLSHPAIHSYKVPGVLDIVNPVRNVRNTETGNIVVITANEIFRLDPEKQTFHSLMKLRYDHPAIPVIGRTPYSMYYNGNIYELNETQTAFRIVRKDIPYMFSLAGNKDMLAVGGGGLMIFRSQDSLILLKNYRINNVMIDRNGRIWAGMWQEGLFRITFPNGGKEPQIEDLGKYLNDQSVRSLFEDRDGNIWVGTRYRGLTVFSAKDNFKKVRHLNEEHGLFSNWVNTIEQSPDGTIWIGTLSGINKIIPDNQGYRVFNFSRIVNYFAAVYTIAFSGKNDLWCSSDRGLVRVTDQYLEKAKPLPVVITQVQIGRSDSNYASAAKLQLKYHENNARFEFTAPSYINETEMNYRYRLTGSGDTSWSDPANIHSVQYASLKPGTYRFEVSMIGWNGDPGPVDSFPFSIAAPFWQKWWFYAIIAALIFVMLYFVYRYRIRQLLKLQQVRNSIATDLHDDIGSTLTNISILSELTRKNLQEPPQANKYIQRITEEVTASGQALDDIIWSVNSKNDTLEETLVRMRRFAAELFDHTNTRCYLELEPDAAGKKLSMEQRRDLYLVYKESLNNIYKHATAQSVRITMSMVGNSVKLQIRDDGSGFDPEGISRGNGLNNLRTRVEKWKGKIKIISAPGKGSDIEILMPVN